MTAPGSVQGAILQDGAVVGKPPHLGQLSTASRDAAAARRDRRGRRGSFGSDRVRRRHARAGRDRRRPGARTRADPCRSRFCDRPGSSVDNDVLIGERVRVQTNCYLTAHMVVEDDAFIGPGVITTNDDSMARHPEGEPRIGPDPAAGVPDRWRGRPLSRGRDRRGGVRRRRSGGRPRRPAPRGGRGCAGAPDPKRSRRGRDRTMAVATSTRRAGAAVPLFATRPALEPLVPLIAERQRAVLESGRYILGPEVEAFEAEFAAFVGRRHCIGVANGTESLTIALRALGVRPGDEVVVPGVSFFATAGAVVNAGARPVFADIDSETHCMTAATVEPVLTERTRALVPVHLFGNPAPMDELTALARSRGLAVLEDAAQAAGAVYRGGRAGAHGDAASFSFYPGKNLGAVGDAGAILTDDDDVAETARTAPRPRAAGGLGARGGGLQLAPGRAPSGRAEGPAPGARGLDRARRDGGLRVRASRNPRAGRCPAGDRGCVLGLPPLRGPDAGARRALRRPTAGGGRDQGLLHDPAQPPAGARRWPAARAAAELREPRLRGPRTADGAVARRSGGQPRR